MPPSSQQILDALARVTLPGISRDIVSFGFVESVEVDGGEVRIRLNVPAGSPHAVEQMAKDAHAAASSVTGVEVVKLDVVAPMAKGAAAAPGSQPRLPGPVAAAPAGRPLGTGGRRSR